MLKKYPKRICKNHICGKSFRAKSATHAFCSSRCRKQYEKRLLKEEKRIAKEKAKTVTRVCKNTDCLKEFIPARNNQYYCCYKCEQHAWYLRYKESKARPLILVKSRGFKPRVSLEQAVALARAEGLTYGQYYNKHGYDGWF